VATNQLFVNYVQLLVRSLLREQASTKEPAKEPAVPAPPSPSPTKSPTRASNSSSNQKSEPELENAGTTMNTAGNSEGGMGASAASAAAASSLEPEGSNDLDANDLGNPSGSTVGGGFAAGSLGGFGSMTSGGSGAAYATNDAGGSEDKLGDEEEGSDDSASLDASEKESDDPVEAAVQEAEKLASQTTEVQKILNGVKASIQANFSDYKDAWPIVNALKNTNNSTLQAVASRLALFIADTLQENSQVLHGKLRRFDNNKERKKMRITKEQLRKLVREAVRQRLLAEGLLAEETSYLEQEKMRQEVNMLALEFLEKLTQKLSIDTSTLSPEALQAYKTIHKNLEYSVRSAAAELFKLSTILNAAKDN
jgi:hypothetical protein